MLNFDEAVPVRSPSQDYYIFKEVIKLDFNSSIKDENKKRIDLAEKISDQLQKSGQLLGVLGYGSPYYGSAKKHSDLDLVGLSPNREKPFKAYFVVEDPKTKERIGASLRGYILGCPTLSFSGRKKLESYISGKIGLWSLTYPSIFEKISTSVYAKYSSLDAIDTIRRIIHDAYLEGIKEVTIKEIFRRHIEIEKQLNRSLFKKPRLENGLSKIILENLEHASESLTGEFLTMKGNIYVINDDITQLKKEPIDLSLSQKRIEEWLFRRKHIKPIIKDILPT